MSSWTYINGNIVVSPLGRTQAEKRYILETVLEHLPNVTGSEKDMNVYVIQKAGYNNSSSCDEFGEVTSNLIDNYGDRSRRHGWLKTQSKYILVVEGSFRDRLFDQTYKEFQKWLCRLAKRVYIDKCLVEIEGWKRKSVITNDTAYSQMYEYPTQTIGNKNGEINWCEYLMWQRMDNYDYPAVLGYKYFDVPENNEKVERWININR